MAILWSGPNPNIYIWYTKNIKNNIHRKTKRKRRPLFLSGFLRCVNIILFLPW
jgi:hypothetical protein